MLRRPDGVELIGEFEGSGFKNAPLLARRADGQVVQLTKLLYAVAEAADGRRDLQAVADVVSERCGRAVTAANVAALAQRKLRPLGVIELSDGTTPALKTRPPVMALRHRKPILSERAVDVGARTLAWLHRPILVLVILASVAVFDMWLFGFHGIAGGVHDALYNPVLLFTVIVSIVIATAFHEFGHASACRYGGACPGVIGVGAYLVWPVFYCDVTDAYRLNRAGRLRTDLGGIYFNLIAVLVAGAVFLATGQEVALLVAALLHIIVLIQLIPLMRFDGYYVLSDLTGVPDILSRIKPIFRSLVRGRKREPRVAELKPWVRFVVTAYLVMLVPALALLFAWMVIVTPRIVATIYDSVALQIQHIGQARPAGVAVAAVHTGLLGMQLGAIALSLGRVGKVACRRVVHWARGSTRRTAVAMAGTVALTGAVAWLLWPGGPGGDYRPIQPDERGTVPEQVAPLVNETGVPQLLVDNPDGAPQTGETSGSGAGTLRTGTAGGASRYEGGQGTRRPADGSTRPPATAPDTGGGTDEVTGPPEEPTDPPTTDEDPATTPPPEATGPSGTGESTSPTTPGTTPSPTTGGTGSTDPGGSSADSGDSSALAVNTEDGWLVFSLTFAVIHVTDDVVDNRNLAVAYASCTLCRTIAISVQTIFIDGAATVIAPVNAAISENVNCDRCDTMALAYQFVIGIGTALDFTEEGRRRVADIQRQLVLLSQSGLTGPEIYAIVHALMVQYADVLETELVAVGEPSVQDDAGGTTDTSPDDTGTTSMDGSSSGTPDATDPTAPPTGDTTPDESATSDSTTTTSPGGTTSPDESATSDPTTTTSPGDTTSPDESTTPDTPDGTTSTGGTPSSDPSETTGTTMP